MNWENQVQSDIEECDEIIAADDSSKAKVMCEHIRVRYDGKVKKLMRGNTEEASYIPTLVGGKRDESKIDYIKDVKTFKTKLENHLYELKEKADGENQCQAITVNNTVSASVTNVNANIQTLIMNSNLDQESKDKLCEMQNDIEALKKDNNQNWKKKATDVIKWVADKGVDFAIAYLPDIIKTWN